MPSERVKLLSKRLTLSMGFWERVCVLNYRRYLRSQPCVQLLGTWAM